jgi:gamma-glutamyltranspeptidase/glutathione hydrolase
VREQFLTYWPTSAALWLQQGAVPAAGGLFKNPALAETYTRILRESAADNREAEIERARRIWSEGFVAEAIDRFCRTEEVMDTSGRAHRGLLTGADMAAWSARIEAPIGYDYRQFRVLKPGPWCQGLVTLQQLALLKEFPLDDLDPTGADFIHWQVEAAKLAFADRDTFYGDPDFVGVPVDVLLSDEYNAARRRLIEQRASLEQRPGTIPGFGKAFVSATVHRGGAAGAGEPTVGRLGEASGDTVHFDIIDRHGNMVAATPSGGWLQSSPTIPDLGFCLGTRAQMFVLDADHPSCLAPGKRPRSTLSPTLALRDGEPYLTWGTPGGDQQDQWIPQLFLRHVHAGMNLQEAIDAPAWHTEHFPSSFWPRTARPGVLVVEGRVPAATVDELRRRGHHVEIGPDWSEGRLVAAARDHDLLKAAANPRGMQGYAAGR